MQTQSDLGKFCWEEEKHAKIYSENVIILIMLLPSAPKSREK